MDAISYLTRQLPYLAPALLVYLAGLVVSLVFMGKHPRPATLVLVASLLLLGATIAVPVIQFNLLHAQEAGHESLGSLDQSLKTLGIGGSIVRAVGFVLLLAAAFVGRAENGGQRRWGDESRTRMP